MSKQQFFILRGDHKVGPISPSRLKSLATSGKVSPTSLVSLDGEKWVEAGKVKGLVFAEPVKRGRVSKPLAVLIVVMLAVFTSASIYAVSRRGKEKPEPSEVVKIENAPDGAWAVLPADEEEPEPVVRKLIPRPADDTSPKFKEFEPRVFGKEFLAEAREIVESTFSPFRSHKFDGNFYSLIGYRYPAITSGQVRTRSDRYVDVLFDKGMPVCVVETYIDRVDHSLRIVRSPLGKPSFAKTFTCEYDGEEESHVLEGYFYKKSIAYLNVCKSSTQGYWARLYWYDREWFTEDLAKRTAGFMADLAFLKKHVVDKFIKGEFDSSVVKESEAYPKIFRYADKDGANYLQLLSREDGDSDDFRIKIDLFSPSSMLINVRPDYEDDYLRQEGDFRQFRRQEQILGKRDQFMGEDFQAFKCTALAASRILGVELSNNKPVYRGFGMWDSSENVSTDIGDLGLSPFFIVWSVKSKP